jgi:hypothetical protein
MVVLMDLVALAMESFSLVKVRAGGKLPLSIGLHF